MKHFRFKGFAYDTVPVLATIALGVCGGLLARAIGAPLPWLAGALVVIATASLSGLRIQDKALQFPVDIRKFFIPIVGVSIGGAFTPELLSSALTWWPTALALFLFVPVAHAASFVLYTRIGRLDPITAYFAAMPGGLIESIAIGEKEGADAATLALLQFSRLIFCILCVPLIFMGVEGVAVGSAAGATMTRGPGGDLGLLDIVILVAAGVIGLYGGEAIRLPAALITGPVLVSGAAHLAGITDAVPPGWLVNVTQLVVGVSLGVRFVGLSLRSTLSGLGLALASVLCVLSIAGLFGLAFAGAVRQPIEAVFLAFAPGGVVEMSLIAVSLHISVVYVTMHHVVRILLTVFVAQFGFRPVLRLIGHETKS